MSKPHLPITQEKFDSLIHGIVREANKTNDLKVVSANLSDDELLIFAEVTELMLETGDEQVQADLAATRVWMDVYAACKAEIEVR